MERKRRFRIIPVFAFFMLTGLMQGCDVAVDIQEFIRTLFNCECPCRCAETYLAPDEQTFGGSLGCVNKTNPSQTCGQVCTQLSIGQSLGSGSFVVCQ